MNISVSRNAGTPNAEIRAIQEAVVSASIWVAPLRQQFSRVIVGQQHLVDRLMIGLLTNGHILLEGVPGLGKTLALKTLAQALAVSFQRIQFTPDMLPADVVGTMIYNPRDGSFQTKHGPVFANLILADEINRAPAKVQSALLEAMQERQVTLGSATHALPEPFMVMATQNPIEQEGTYPLPEAQVDRFMLKLKVTYPGKEDELAILDRMAAVEPRILVEPVLGPDDLFELRVRDVVPVIQPPFIDQDVGEDCGCFQQRSDLRKRPPGLEESPETSLELVAVKVGLEARGLSKPRLVGQHLEDRVVELPHHRKLTVIGPERCARARACN